MQKYMMKLHENILLLWIFIVHEVSTDQHLVDYIAEHVTVKVHVVDNTALIDGYVQEYVSLSNTGSMDISNGDWKIYHNSLYGKRDEELHCGLRNHHALGGLYYLTPNGDKFKTFKAGETLVCIIHNRYSLAARSDYMPNWYVTSNDAEPKTVVSTMGEGINYVEDFDSYLRWKHGKTDQYKPYSPEERYDMYKMYDSPKYNPYKIVPTPWSVTSNRRVVMTFNIEEWMIVYSDAFKFESTYLADILGIAIHTSRASNKYIQFVKTNDSNLGPESYNLNIDAALENIEILANENPGAFYGVQTLVSLIEGCNGEMIAMNIMDKPRFLYRGIMIDTARNFKPVKWILKMIDAMSMYKLNKLHFHLTDDEGWRIQIPSIPELTEIGSKRCHSEIDGVCLPPQLGSGPHNTTLGTGFYSVDEYKTILKYADDRHVEVIPEIETPGHSSAAITAMNYRESKISRLESIGEQNLPPSYLLEMSMERNMTSSPLKWPRNAIDPCLNTSYKFISKVLDALIDIHKDVQPLKTVHVGGDEVPDGAWDESQACKENDIHLSTKQQQKSFMKQVADIASSKGLDIGVWDDGVYAEDKPDSKEDYKSENVYVYPWDTRGDKIKHTAEFADAGYKVVLSLATYLYFGHTQGPDPEERGLYWATRYTDTQKVFGLMPDDLYANVLEDNVGNTIDINTFCDGKICPILENPGNIIGLEASMFSENMRTEEEFYYMGFPRIVAMAEKSWHKASWEDINDVIERNKERDIQWKEFSDNLGFKELSRLDKRNISYRLPPPGVRLEENVLKVNTKYPNLLIEASNDIGKSWETYTESKIQAGSYSYLLRTKSRTGDIYSRSVEFKFAVSSSMTSSWSWSTSLIILTVISLLNLL
ncbi:hypothetical protein ACF0H5_000788 [Mactra antiquata]